MSAAIKELIVILAIAAMVFKFARPIALRFISELDFARRRNVWFVLTITALLSPSFWLFAVVAIPLLAWAGRKDTNPVGLYLILLHVIPPIAIAIPVSGINQLFDLDNYRLLSFCVLIPTAWRLRKSRDVARIRGLQAMDVLLLAYGALQVILFVPPDLPSHIILQNSPTNVLRETFLFYVDVYVLYFVVSRSCTDRRTILDAMAAFCLSSTVMAAIGVFEGLRHWLLYAELATRWDANDAMASFSYLFRGDALRAQASTGQGMLAAYSRGPWLGAVAIYVAFVAFSPRAFSGLFKAASVGVVLAAALSMSPVGDRIVRVLPFLGGSVDSTNVDYRHRLAARSWELIQAHPFFGDQLAFLKMQDLRQGQGIIDVVNTYAGIALFNGLIGLCVFAGFILIALFKVYRTAKGSARTDPDFALLGTTLVACILGVLLMLENCSFILGVEKLFYVLAGLAAAYAHLGRSLGRLPTADLVGGSTGKSR
jgi:hypothetical protein